MAKSDAHRNRENIGPQHSLSRGRDIEHPWKHKIHEIVVPESSQKPFHEVFRPFESLAQAMFGHGLRLQADARQQSANVRGCSR